MEEKNKTLYYLDELPGYQVADDYDDVRGWAVKDAGDRTIGKVEGLLVNKQSERVVYLDVEVDPSVIEEGYETYNVPASEGVHGFLNKEGENHIIVPIGLVELDSDKQEVLTNEIDRSTFGNAKRFSKGTDITREYEILLFDTYVPGGKLDAGIAGEDIYNRKEFRNR